MTKVGLNLTLADVEVYKNENSRRSPVTIAFYQWESDEYQDDLACWIFRIMGDMDFDVLVFEGIILIVVPPTFDKCSRSSRSSGAQKDEESVLKSLALVRVVVIAQGPVMVEYRLDVIIIHSCSELIDLRELIFFLENVMDMLEAFSLPRQDS